METSHPTARALAVLEALQDEPGVSAARLARRLGVTDRAVRRYVALLRDAGIPVESTAGPYGGYRLGRGSRLPPLRLSAAEALGLVMATLESRPGVLDRPDDPVGSAIARIVRVLPASLADSVGALRQVTTDTAAVDGRTPDPETTAALVGAVEARRRVRFTYRTSRERTMDVDPWAVVVWRGRWYLLGWSRTAGARRVLRVDRVADVVVLDDQVTVPEGLDPIATVEEHMSTGWRFRVEVLVEAPPDAVARWLPRNLGRLEPAGEGRTRLLGSTDEPEWYAWKLSGIAARFHVVAPDELRDAVRALGANLVRAASSDEVADRAPVTSPTADGVDPS